MFPQLLGFPIQLLGLLTLPYLGVRYYVDKTGKPADDFNSAAVSHLPACALLALLALLKEFWQRAASSILAGCLSLSQKTVIKKLPGLE